MGRGWQDLAEKSVFPRTVAKDAEPDGIEHLSAWGIMAYNHKRTAYKAYLHKSKNSIL